MPLPPHKQSLPIFEKPGLPGRINEGSMEANTPETGTTPYLHYNAFSTGSGAEELGMGLNPLIFKSSQDMKSCNKATKRKTYLDL
jgi:hypothetical protein